MATFDVDEMGADFQAVDIIFRGEEYLLGGNALGLLDACELHGTIEDKDGTVYLKAFLEILPELMKSLCPELVLEQDTLVTGEQMALVKVVTEVLGRISRLTFPAEKPEGDDS